MGIGDQPRQEILKYCSWFQEGFILGNLWQKVCLSDLIKAKFNDPQQQYLYRDLIKANDKEKILDLLTVPKVENALLVRVQQKALIYGQEVIMNKEGVLSVDSSTLKIPQEIIKNIYKDIIIPLTKEVEVEYLLQRVY